MVSSCVEGSYPYFFGLGKLPIQKRKKHKIQTKKLEPPSMERYELTCLPHGARIRRATGFLWVWGPHSFWH